MDRDDIRRFMARDWALVARAKEAHWVARKHAGGPMLGLRIAESLRLQARAERPDWPGDADRADDLAAHVHLSELFRRADAARPD